LTQWGQTNYDQRIQKYEEEIKELEKERGNDVVFVNPDPGFVVKTLSQSPKESKKVFINICSSEHIGKPVGETSNLPHRKGVNWKLPYSLTPPRDGLDKGY
jgi:dynein assembly factor 2